MDTATQAGNPPKATQKSAATIGTMHVVIALLGILPIVLLTAFTFRSVFSTAGDVLALFSYIAAIIGAVCGVPIAVRGAQASAENKVVKDSSLNAIPLVDEIKSDFDGIAKTLRKVGNSPTGQSNYLFEPNQPLNLSKQEEISADKLANIQGRIETIGKMLQQMAK